MLLLSMPSSIWQTSSRGVHHSPQAHTNTSLEHAHALTHSPQLPYPLETKDDATVKQEPLSWATHFQKATSHAQRAALQEHEAVRMFQTTPNDESPGADVAHNWSGDRARHVY